tara:strand:+ start:4011 stop:5147 length:1137 start_codon:yes stop_codon:yes gene_type:complete
MHMAGTADKVESGIDKVQKKSPFASEEIRKSAWAKAEKSITNGKPEGALLVLREVDASGSHPTTLRLAGQATHKIAQRTNSKSEYRKAAALLRDSVKMNPKDKTSNNAYNEVLNEMQDKRISESVIPRMMNDGTPTAAGIFAFVASLVLILAGLGVLAQPKEVSVGDVIMELTWTDTDGTFHEGTIWIQLYEDSTPMHAESFRANTDAGRYDGTIFHRIVDGFMIQGGDFENRDGTGGHAGKYFGYCASTGFSESTECENQMTDWVIPAEFGETHDPGVIAAARSQSDNSAGSQFYLVDSTGANTLDNQYTAFGIAYKGLIDGEQTTGVEVIDQISQVGCGTTGGTCTDSNKLSTYPVTVVSAQIAGSGSDKPWYQFW